MNKTRFTLLAIPVVLTACAGGILVDGMPLTSVVRYPDGNEAVFRGRIMPRMDFSSTFTMANDEGVECAGSFRANGQGSMECTDGLSTNLTVPRDQYGRSSGSYVERTGNVGVAVGWGDESDPDSLRRMFGGA